MEVDVVEELGSDAYIYGRTAHGDQPLVARADWRNPPAKGAVVNLWVDPAHVHFFAPEDGRRLA
jgi:multiple sugar transport system ATP-binding protein